MARIKNPLSASLKKLAKLAQKERLAYQSKFEVSASNLEVNAREDFTKRFFQNKFGNLT
ncbi:MAG: hypothetical protein ACPGJS_19905 [Flammeovirgaceae bacterium]